MNASWVVSRPYRTRAQAERELERSLRHQYPSYGEFPRAVRADEAWRVAFAAVEEPGVADAILAFVREHHDREASISVAPASDALRVRVIVVSGVEGYDEIVALAVDEGQGMDLEGHALGIAGLAGGNPRLLLVPAHGGEVALVARSVGDAALLGASASGPVSIVRDPLLYADPDVLRSGRPPVRSQRWLVSVAPTAGEGEDWAVFDADVRWAVRRAGVRALRVSRDPLPEPLAEASRSADVGWVVAEAGREPIAVAYAPPAAALAEIARYFRLPLSPPAESR